MIVRVNVVLNRTVVTVKQSSIVSQIVSSPVAPGFKPFTVSIQIIDQLKVSHLLNWNSGSLTDSLLGRSELPCESPLPCEYVPVGPGENPLNYEDTLANFPGVWGYAKINNRFHVTVGLFSNRSQMTSKCGKNKEVAHVFTKFCRPR